MVYRGRVCDGKIELDGDVRLPDGAAVTVQLDDARSGSLESDDAEESLRAMLRRHAGTADGLPPDAARNLDHYLYGLPKK